MTLPCQGYLLSLRKLAWILLMAFANAYGVSADINRLMLIIDWRSPDCQIEDLLSEVIQA